MNPNTDCCGTSCIVPDCAVCNPELTTDCKKKVSTWAGECWAQAKNCGGKAADYNITSCENRADCADCAGCTDCKKKFTRWASECWARAKNCSGKAVIDCNFTGCENRVDCTGCATKCADCSRGMWAGLRAVRCSTWLAILFGLLALGLSGVIAYLFFFEILEPEDTRCSKWMGSLNETQLNSICECNTLIPDDDSGIGDQPFIGSPFGYRYRCAAWEKVTHV